MKYKNESKFSLHTYYPTLKVDLRVIVTSL